MPLVESLASGEARVEHVWDEVSALSRFHGQAPEVSGTGEMNVVIITSDSVTKIPHAEYGRGMADFEAEIIIALNEADTASPLTLPVFIHNNSSSRYSCFERVPGHVLTQEAVRSFSSAEKQVLGERVGRFVAWMGHAIPRGTYDEILSMYSISLPDRVQHIKDWGRRVRTGSVHDPLAADVLQQTHDAYRDYAARGLLEPTIIGHDDIRPDNLAFTRRDGMWVPTGIFDFGLTKPSSPERELRHAATLGSVALEAAIDTYEDLTQVQLSRQLIQFWAVAQSATNYASCLRSENLELAATKRRDLHTLLVEYPTSSNSSAPSRRP